MAAAAVRPRRLEAGPLGFGDGTLLLTTGAGTDLVEAGGAVTLPATDGPSFALWTL